MYAWFAWTAFKVVNDAGSSSADKQQAMSQQLMSSGGGRFLVGAGRVWASSPSVSA